MTNQIRNKINEIGEEINKNRNLLLNLTKIKKYKK